jgi:YVTN family beta-propeller protein
MGVKRRPPKPERFFAAILLSLFLVGCQDAFDVIPPSVHMLSPLNHERASGDVRVVVVATDAHLKQTFVYLDGNLIGQGASETLSFTCSIPDTFCHTLRAKATDYRGNFGVASIEVNPVSEVEVRSIPSGASVWLDGQDKHDTTDCVLQDVATVCHLVRLTKSGYLDWQDTVSVVRGETTFVSATLVAAPYPDSVIAEIPVGNAPSALAWNETNGRIYCANNWDSTISVIDPSALKVVRTVTTGSLPYALTWNSATNSYYCACVTQNAPRICVYDGSSNSCIATIPVWVMIPVLASNSTDKKVYCADEITGTFVIDGTSNSVIDTLELEGCDAICWNQTLDRVYIAIYGYSALDVFSGSTGELVGTVPDAFGWSLTWSSAGNKLYCAYDDVVKVVDCQRDSVVATITGLNGVNLTAWNETANKLYCASGSQEGVTVIDCATNSVVKHIPTPGHHSQVLVYDRTNNRVFSADRDNNSVLVIGTRP